MKTKTGQIREDSRLPLQKGNWLGPDPWQWGSRPRHREQDMDRSSPQTLQYPKDHNNWALCRCKWSNQSRAQPNCWYTFQTHSLLQRTEWDVDCQPTGSVLGEQDHRQTYNQIFLILLYVLPIYSTPDWAEELNMDCSQLNSRNQQYSITESG